MIRGSITAKDDIFNMSLSVWSRSGEKRSLLGDASRAESAVHRKKMTKNLVWRNVPTR
jgi:hypothetical protein